MITYCAPAARPFLRLHIAEDGADLKAPAGSEGLTLCGQVMAWSDLWVPITARDGDTICADCQGEAQGLPPLQLVLGE